MTKRQKQETPEITSDKTQEPEYSLDKLRENCKELFDVPAHVFDGAMCGITGEFTVREAKSKIEKWAKKEVV
jgi:hypothetical protein